MVAVAHGAGRGVAVSVLACPGRAAVGSPGRRLRGRIPGSGPGARIWPPGPRAAPALTATALATAAGGPPVPRGAAEEAARRLQVAPRAPKSGLAFLQAHGARVQQGVLERERQVGAELRPSGAASARGGKLSSARGRACHRPSPCRGGTVAQGAPGPTLVGAGWSLAVLFRRRLTPPVMGQGGQPWCSGGAGARPDLG